MGKFYAARETGLIAASLNLPHIGGGEIAGDAVDAGTVRPVRRQIESRSPGRRDAPFRITCPTRRVRRESRMPSWSSDNCSSNPEHNMPRLSTPRNRAYSERDVLARDEGAGRREHAFMPARAFGAPHNHLNGIARSGVDHAHAQPVRIGVLLGGNHPRDGERRQRLRLFSTFSTSRPIMVSLCTMRRAVRRCRGDP